MFSTSIIVVIVATMIVTINAENVNQTKGNKTCDVKEVDKCATALTPLTDADFLERPPKTLAEIDQWCRKFKQSVACVRQYSDKCLAEESRRTLSII
ncbi:hypothetical protein BLA29_013816, partial [Euroglyphus maynei]